jgi:hypothetical protein
MLPLLCFVGRPPMPLLLLVSKLLAELVLLSAPSQCY